MEKLEFIKCFQNADIHRLSEKLDENMPYCGATKAAFIEKLTYMNLQSILSWQKKNGFKIKIKEKSEDEFHIYLHIFSRVLRLKVKLHQGEIIEVAGKKPWKKYSEDLIDEFKFSFAQDELLNFVPDENYLSTLEQCRQAINEVEAEGNNILSKADLSTWVKKYATLYHKDALYYYRGFNKFREIYQYLEYLESISHAFLLATMAIENYEHSVKDENFLTNWVYNFEWIKINYTLDPFLIEDIANENLYLLCEKFSIYLKGPEFNSIHRFEAIFQKHAHLSRYF
jgi:hypothetical protein